MNMKNNTKKAKSALSVPINIEQQTLSSDNIVNNGMDNSTLPSATMLLHTNGSHQQISSSDSPMNQYSDIYSSRQSGPTNNKSNKRKLDEFVDVSSADFESPPNVKPQKTEQNDPDNSINRTENPLSNGPPPSSTPSRNGNDNCSGSYEFAPPTNNVGNSTPNSSLLTRQTPPPQSLPPSLQGSSYMPMSPRNQYTITSDTPYLQTNNQVFVFTTQLANDAAEAVIKNEYPNIIEYHKSLPQTIQHLSSASNNIHNSSLGGPPHMNPPPGCHSPRTMQMMMSGPHHNPHLPHHNGNNGPPSNWVHPHYHQQQPPFGRLTPGPGGLPPPNHLLPPGARMINGSPPPGMHMGGMPPMPGMNQPPSDGIENLTPERAKHRKNQLEKIQEMKTKIAGGRGRGGRGKANAAAAAAANMPPSMDGGPLDPHQRQMMMMNSPHGVGPPHHMMGIGPPPPHMLPAGMRGPDGMMLDMNGPPPPHGYMNGPMPPNFHGQYGAGPGDPYGQLLPHHPQSQAAREWNKMQMEHLEAKNQQIRGQPPPYSSTSPSSGIGGLGPNGKLLSPRIESASTPRLYKVGQPEKFIPESLPSSGNKKLPGNVGEVQLTASPTQMDYNEFGMEGEELVISRHFNRAYRGGNGTIGGPLSSSSCKDEPMTPSARSTSTPNNNSSSISSGQQQSQQPPGSTTPTHHPQGITPQSVPAASPRSSKLQGNNNLSSPLTMPHSNSAKDEPLDLNNDPKTPTSNMAPPLSSMLQMTNSLQSNSPYNSSNMPGSKQSLNNPNMGHMSKQMEHMNMPPQNMQLPNMNPHQRMMCPPDSMPHHYNPHHSGNLPPPHPHMYKVMPPHHPMDPNGMMMSHPGGPSRPPKGLIPPPQSSDPMQQHLHHLPPPHYIKMHNMDPLLGPSPHQQQHMRFSPMMDDNYAMGPPPPHHHPYMHPHMHPHHPMHLNDGRLPPQSINNTYVSATMSIQQLNIQSLGSGGPPNDLQAGTIHYHAPPGNGSDPQQQQFQGNDPQFSAQYNDLQAPPSNLSVDGGQPPPYW